MQWAAIFYFLPVLTLRCHYMTVCRLCPCLHKVAEAGILSTWGRTQDGRLGIGPSTVSSQTLPRQVEHLLGKKITQVACGQHNTAAVSGALPRIVVSSHPLLLIITQTTYAIQ